MTSNRADERISNEPLGLNSVEAIGAVGGHDHLKDAPQVWKLLERLAIAYHVTTHASIHGPTYEECNEPFCKEFRELRDGRPAAGAD